MTRTCEGEHVQACGAVREQLSGTGSVLPATVDCRDGSQVPGLHGKHVYQLSYRDIWFGVFETLCSPQTSLEVVILLPQPPNVGTIDMHHPAQINSLLFATRSRIHGTLSKLTEAHEPCFEEIVLSNYMT